MRRRGWDGFTGTDQAFEQSSRGDLEGQVMEVGPVTTSEQAHLLKLLETGLGQAQIFEADRNA